MTVKIVKLKENHESRLLDLIFSLFTFGRSGDQMELSHWLRWPTGSDVTQGHVHLSQRAAFFFSIIPNVNKEDRGHVSAKNKHTIFRE